MSIILCDRAFGAEIQDCVDRFNQIASNHQERISERIECLKQIFDRLYDLAISEVNNTRQNPNFLDQAILRTQHIMDVMGDDDYSGAPSLVQERLLDHFTGAVMNIWQPLAVHRHQKLEWLRLSLDSMLQHETEIIMNRQRKTRQLQH